MPMQLMMYIGNDLIEAVPLQKEGLRQPGYLGKFKRHLKAKYHELISQSPQPPEPWPGEDEAEHTAWGFFMWDE